MRVSSMDVGCPVCDADITMVMHISSYMTDYAEVPWRYSAELLLILCCFATLLIKKQNTCRRYTIRRTDDEENY